MIDDLTNNIYEFQLFTPKFCKEAVALAETLDKWTQDRHVFYPTNDVLLQDIQLQEIYHMCVNKLHNLNISDDEQHIFYACYDEKPEIFHLEHIVEEPWPKALTYYEKSDL